jgi:pseudouridine-5'-monophosphatase
MRLPRRATHVIYDMDGVLLDTECFYTEVTRAILGRYGKDYDWSIKGQLIGRPELDSARHLVAALDLPITAEQYLEERRAGLARLMPTCEAMPGARELARALHERGVGQAVATSSTSAMFALKTERHRDWFTMFSAVVLGDDPRLRRGKPAPDIFFLAAEDLGADPARCVVIEDSPVGIEAAHAAGMQAIAVPHPEMDRTRFGRAELIVASLAELTPADLGFAPA